MRTLLMTSALLTVFGATPGIAEEYYPWCVIEPGHGSYECRFTSYEQCQATSAGLGVCNRNPSQAPASGAPASQNSPPPVAGNANGRKRTN